MTADEPLPILEELASETPLLAHALSRLARGDPTDFAADLRIVENHREVDGTSTRTHCYSLESDGLGAPRVVQLVTAVCARVVDYAIPRTRIIAALTRHSRTGATDLLVRLTSEARSLFTRLASTGEAGELLLFCIAESLLGLPQILAKMSLKTSSGLHYNGCDAVHASADPRTGGLKLWWGEAKLHGTATEATTKCLQDLAPYLIEPNGPTARRERDVALLRHNVDLADPAVERAIRTFLDASHIAHNRLTFGGLGLIGFDHDCYPKDAKAVADEVATKVAAAVTGWRSHARTRLAAERLDDVDLHLLFLPFPSVEGFRAEFRRQMGLN